MKLSRYGTYHLIEITSITFVNMKKERKKEREIPALPFV